MSSNVRRLVRVLDVDAVVCTCGRIVEVRFVAQVGQALPDVLTQSVKCTKCGALWGVQFHVRPRRVTRVERLQS